ncbi:MAG: DNA-binding protein [Betaproteobacteria bacterium]|nr:DNA-binding protein [Betaproteobacteria bacterium]
MFHPVKKTFRAIVKLLDPRALRHTFSVGAEHTMQQVHRHPLAEVLAAMPNVGEDADFSRVREHEAKSAGVSRFSL